MARARRSAKRYTALDEARLAVEIWAMRWHEAEVALDSGLQGATCSGPERFWMSERLKAKDELMRACDKLKALRQAMTAPTTPSSNGQNK